MKQSSQIPVPENGNDAEDERSLPLSRREVIFQACDELLASRERVTESKIRAIVGGSPNTVHRYVSEWKKTYSIKRQAMNVPSTVLSELDKVFTGMRESLEKDFEERVKAAEEEASQNDDELTAVEEALEEAQQNLNERVSQIEGLQTLLQQREETTEALSNRIEELKEELAFCLRKREEQEEAHRQLISQHAIQLEQERARIDKEVERLDRIYQVSEDRLMRQMDSLRTRYEDELDELTKDLARAREANESQRHEWEEKLQLSNETRQEKEVENASLAAKVVSQETVIESLKKQIEHLTESQKKPAAKGRSSTSKAEKKS